MKIKDSGSLAFSLGDCLDFPRSHFLGGGGDKDIRTDGFNSSTILTAWDLQMDSVTLPK